MPPSNHMLTSLASASMMSFMPNQRWIRGDETADLQPTVNRNIAEDKDGKLWFRDETGTQACGPFDTIRDCLHGIEGYVKELG